MDTKLVYSVAEVAVMPGIAVGTAYESLHRGTTTIRLVRPSKALVELLEQVTEVGHATSGNDIADTMDVALI